MYNISNNCKDCIHNKVCNYKEKYNERIKEIIKLQENMEDIFYTLFECREYRPDVSIKLKNKII